MRMRRDIQLVMLLVFVLGTFGMNFQITMALMATKVFDKGAGSSGCSARSWPSARSPPPCSRRGARCPPAGAPALAGLTVAAALAAMAPTFSLFALALVPVGLTALTALTTANAMVQSRVAPEMRGG